MLPELEFLPFAASQHSSCHSPVEATPIHMIIWEKGVYSVVGVIR